MKLPKQSLTELADTRDVALINHDKHANLYVVDYEGNRYYEVISNTTFEVIYRTESRFFAIRRFQETNQD